MSDSSASTRGRWQRKNHLDFLRISAHKVYKSSFSPKYPTKSKYGPGPAVKIVNLKIESDENGIKIDAEGTDGDGNPTHVRYDAKFDGKDYPVTGLPYGDTVSVKRIDANTLQSTLKKGGQVVMTVTSTVSNYWKMRTSTFKGKDAQGRDVNNIVVYDKQ